LFQTAISLYLFVFALYLFRSDVRSEFTSTAPNRPLRWLMVGYALVAILIGFGLVNTASKIDRWSKGGAPIKPVARILEKQTQENIERLRQNTGIRLPDVGYMKKPFENHGVSVATFFNTNSPMFIVVIDPNRTGISLTDLFSLLDSDYTQKVESKGTFVKKILQSRKGSWSRLSPSTVTKDTVMVLSRSFLLSEVSFAKGSKYRNGHMLELNLEGKRILALAYGEGETRDALLIWSYVLLKLNHPEGTRRP